MSTDVEKLVVQLSADIKQYQREMQRGVGVTHRQASAIENRLRQMDKRLSVFGQNAARGLIVPLTGIAAALTVQEVGRYADAWTGAKNSLAVAGVVGRNQADVLDRIYKSAQASAAPVGAMAGLFGKAAQAGDNLGASQDRLLKFTDGVGTALKIEGKSAAEASGALTQLGQLLGSTRVQAEEFNSVNEGARPILIAVAAGLEEAGGSVNKLKQLVNDGKVSGKQFFDAFLIGLPKIEAMAANSTQTIEQGVTKVTNAFTRYIGQQDEGLGATQRLSGGLNALADDFDTVADVSLKVASVIAAALVGRSIAGMIVKLTEGGLVVARFVKALAAFRTVGAAATAVGGLAAVATPLGVILGVASAAALYFATSSDSAGNSSESAAEKADRYAEALKRVKGAADDAGQAVTDSAKKFEETEKLRLTTQVEGDLKEIDAAAEQILARLQEIVDVGAGTGIRQVAGLGFAISEKEVEGVKAVIEDVNGALKGSVDDAVAAKEGIAALANANPDLRTLDTELEKVLEKLIGAAQAAKEGRIELGKFGVAVNEGNRAAGFSFLSEKEATSKALDDRLAEAQRSELERQVDQRAEQIVKEFGDKITLEAAKIAASKEIAAEQGSRGLDGAVSGYTDRVVGAESDGNANAKNPNSSATGLGQFIERTWLSLFKKYFPGEAASMSDGAILAMRTDAAKSRTLIEAYGRENAATLAAAGIAVNDAADEYKLQLAHFLGPQGAINVLKAAPGTLASSVLSPDAVKANPTILGGGRTVDDVIAYGQKRAGQSTSGTARLDARSNFDKTLKEQQAYIDALKAETGIRAALNPLVDDYGQSLSTLQAAQQLFADAQREGIEAGRELSSVQQLLNGDLSSLSPVAREQALAMRALAEETGKADAAGAQLTVSQQDLRERLAESGSLGKDILGGFIKDLKAGKSGTEALSDALGKLADKMLDNALNLLFDGSVAGSGGGILGGLFSIFTGGPLKLAGGGRVRGPGGPTGDKIPTMLSDGEHVTRSAMAKKYGPLLDAINADRVPMLAEGSPPMRAPNMRRIVAPARNTAGGNMSIAVGVRVDDDGGLQGYVKSVSRSTFQAGIGQYDSGLNRSLPGRINEAMERNG